MVFAIVAKFMEFVFSIRKAVKVRYIVGHVAKYIRRLRNFQPERFALFLCDLRDFSVIFFAGPYAHFLQVTGRRASLRFHRM